MTPALCPTGSVAATQSSRAYGLVLSSSLPIPGASPATPALAAPDVFVLLQQTPSWCAPDMGPEHVGQGDSPPWREQGSGRYSLRYVDDTRFHIDLGAATIWATWPEPLTLEDTATYLLGPVLGFYLRLRGSVCLHASAVVIDGRCIAFMGHARSGKSTLAAAFALLRTPVLTEDVACLDESAGDFSVRPGYPRIRLWNDSTKLLPALRDQLPLLTPNWDKRFLALDSDGLRFHAQEAPLAAVFLLRAPEAMPAPARIEPLSGQQALTGLVANTYGNRLLDRALRGHEFEVLGRLAQRVPVRALTLGEGTPLGDACDWIVQHARA